MIKNLRTEVWLRQDLLSLLKSLDKANACLADKLPGREVALFRAGFRAALEAVAEAIDMQLPPAAKVTVIPSITDGGHDGV